MSTDRQDQQRQAVIQKLMLHCLYDAQGALPQAELHRRMNLAWDELKRVAREEPALLAGWEQGFMRIAVDGDDVSWTTGRISQPPADEGTSL